ncbi:MAG: outer rane efflux protein [Bryobacterales bacterium]|nr:outer rane efflux protein [Bryobacterales bacterium]
MKNRRGFLIPLTLAACVTEAWSQCAGNASTPREAADCTARGTPEARTATIEPSRAYSLAELIDVAEHSDPRTRVAWERAKQKADQLGIERSAYYPILAGVATFAGQRIIEPFPKPLAPLGYITVEAGLLQPEITLQYLLFDSGKRKARVDAATAGTLAAGANFIQVNQDVAFQVASAYYKLLTAQERLQATKDTLKTAQTTQDAAEAQLRNGRSTLPDVLNARAETSQAVFDEESADGDDRISRVGLRNAIGVEPSPDITIDAQKSEPLPQLLALSIEELVERALADRPDLLAQAAEIRAADSAIREAKAEYGPRMSFLGSAAQTSIWPTASYGQLGSASKPTWSAAFDIEWRIFDGGSRRHELTAAESRHREAQDELTDKRDRATREVWSSYIAFRTAIRKEQAAVALLESANASYSASLDAYKYGVKNLVDVVTAEKQLALARLSGVSARSELFLQAVNLEFVTGNLLRNRPPATKPQPPGAPKK